MWKHQKTLERLEDDCRGLRHRVEDLERANKQLGLEWEELYDKVRHQMSRMSKRVPVEPPEIINDVEAEIPPGDPPVIDPVSARILRRRNAGGFRR
jgi:hypothetical protein